MERYRGWLLLHNFPLFSQFWDGGDSMLCHEDKLTAQSPGLLGPKSVYFSEPTQGNAEM